MPTAPPTVGPPWGDPPSPSPWSTGPHPTGPHPTGPWPAGGPAPLWGWRPDPTPPPAPADPSRRGWQIALGVLAVALVVGVAFVALRDTGSTDVALGEEPPPTAPTPTEPAPSTTQPPTTTTQPPTTTTAPPARLAPAVAPPEQPGFHAFLGREDDGDPITWDPCETIQYVVNGRTAPPGAAEVLTEAMAKVTAASGLVFEDRGTTDEPPTDGRRPVRDPARYGDGWSPVLIAWSDPAELPDLDGWVAGWAGPEWLPTGGGEHESVSGTVALDGPDAANLIANGYREDLVQIVMHELGHLVGLDHVDDRHEVMYHNRDDQGEFDAEWNNGDLAGLAQAGNGDCDPDT